MGRIDFPKPTRSKQVNFSSSIESIDNMSKESDLELEIDELKTEKNRIKVENQDRDEEIAKKQNTLQFDDVPTQGSTKPVKSGGVYSALVQKQNNLTASTGITIQNDTISVDSTTIATKTDLASKQDILSAGSNISISNDTISATDTTYSAGTNISIDQNNQISATDTTYTAGTGINISDQNVISTPALTEVQATDVNSQSATSGQVLTADGNGGASWQNSSANITLDNSPTRYSNNAVKSGGVFDALALKQDVIMYDTTPRQNSTSPITSGGVYTALSSKQDTLTAGTGITISNNVISSTASGSSCNCASDIADLQSDIADINAQLLIMQTKINNNSTQYNETIYNEYDVYNRAFDLSGTNTLYCPNVVFSTEPLLTTTNQNNETETEQIKITAYIELDVQFDTAGDYYVKLYEGATIISTYTKTISAEQVNTDQKIKYTINQYSSVGQHNYYIMISKTGGVNGYITLLNQKMEIVAPNVIIQNKVRPFEVSYNYYTGKYYLSDCSSGFAKLAEIDAVNLHSTSDIVWTQTNIEAQNYKTYYIGATDNTTTTLGKRYAIITNKNDTVSIIDMDTGVNIYTAPRGTYNISPTFTKHDYSLLFRNTVYANNTENKYYFLDQSGTVTSSFSFTAEGNMIKTEVIRNNINYLADPASWVGNFSIDKEGNFYYYAKHTRLHQASYKYVDDAKLYMKRCINTSNLDFYCFYKTFGNYYALEGGIVNNSFRFTTDPQLLGTYQDFFMGANNDYFIVNNNALQYCTNLFQS